MSQKKRFTDTGKWEQSWFRKLKPEAKLCFIFLCDRVDQSGCWEIDVDTFKHYTQCRTDFFELVKQLKGIKFLGEMADGEILILTKFIDFQCGELSEKCPAHKPIFTSLRQKGLLDAYSEKTFPFNDTLLNTLSNTLDNRVQEKEKEIEKEKDEEIEICQKVVDWYNEQLVPNIRDGSKVRDLTQKRKTAIRQRIAEVQEGVTGFELFQQVCSLVLMSPFLKGEEANWRADFDWIVKRENWNKILEGKYPPKNSKQEVLSDEDHARGW